MNGVSYLIRVLLPDEPGSLGMLAEAIGVIGGNIQSVDVVHQFDSGTVMDDIVVDLPSGTLPDSIVSAAQEIPGVIIDSLRPFSGVVDRRGQIKMLAAVAENSRRIEVAMKELVDVIPRTMTSGWAIVLGPAGRVAASTAAPEDDGNLPEINVHSARLLDPEEETWVPERWALLDASLAVVPLGETDLLLVVGRPGGPDFLSSEVEHLGNVGHVIGSILKAA